MEDQFIMGPNGDLAIAIPLFRIQQTQELVVMDGYSIAVTKDKPIAYAIDNGSGFKPMLVNAEIVE